MHPKALRDVVVRIVESGETYETAAKLANVGRASVSRWLRKKRETGDLEGYVSPGRPPKIDEEASEILRRLVEEHKSCTDEELTEIFNKRTGVGATRSSVRRALERMGLTRKKSLSLRPSETDRT